MNYNAEMNKMKKHRKEYFPVVSRLVDLYNDTPMEEFPVEVGDAHSIGIILELIDIGYIDPDAVIIVKRFNEIYSLSYNGNFPLTEKGSAYLEENRGVIGKVVRSFKKSLKRS